VRDELLKLTRQVKEHAAWLERGNVAGLPKAPPAPPKPKADAPPPRMAAPKPASGPTGAAGLKVIRDDLGDCTRCKLHPLRKNIVFGVGNPEAPLVFIGEAPGADEDRQGEPFVGAAGQLLNKMIEAMGFAREDVYIANILKCRPPGNRNPEPDEIAQCEPFLRRQLSALRPRMLVCLGKFAAQCLLRSDAPISRLRGHFHEYEGIPLMPTFHPAFLLRNPAAKRDVWDDLKQVMAELDRLGIPRKK
jgi:uracil-DNA glycosylase